MKNTRINVYEQQKIRFQEEIRETAEYWQSAANRYACQGMFPTFRLYYIPQEGLWLVAEGIETTDPLWVKTDTLITPDMNFKKASSTIREAVEKLPILPIID